MGEKLTHKSKWLLLASPQEVFIYLPLMVKRNFNTWDIQPKRWMTIHLCDGTQWLLNRTVRCSQ